MIVRGHRLGMSHDRVHFQDEHRNVTTVEVLDPGTAEQADNGGLWWITFLLRVGSGCYGLRIDSPGFSDVIAVDFRA